MEFQGTISEATLLSISTSLKWKKSTIAPVKVQKKRLAESSMRVGAFEKSAILGTVYFYPALELIKKCGALFLPERETQLEQPRTYTFDRLNKYYLLTAKKVDTLIQRCGTNLFIYPGNSLRNSLSLSLALIGQQCKEGRERELMIIGSIC